MPLERNKDEAWFKINVAEETRGVGMGIGDSAICPETGTVYETITWDLDGVVPKAEGKQAATFDTAEMAWKAWEWAFETYIRNKNGRIYWRTMPELRNPEPGHYFVYARLVATPGRSTLETD